MHDHDHNKQWSCILCSQVFAARLKLEHHIRQNHHEVSDAKSVQRMINMGETSFTSIVDAVCPLCQEIEPSRKHYQRHIGRHQQDLSIFALPNLPAEYLDAEESDQGPKGLEGSDDTASLSSAQEEPANEYSGPLDTQTEGPGDDLRRFGEMGNGGIEWGDLDIVRDMEASELIDAESSYGPRMTELLIEHLEMIKLKDEQAILDIEKKEQEKTEEMRNLQYQHGAAASDVYKPTTVEQEIIEDEMRSRFSEFGFQENQTEAVLGPKKASDRPIGTKIEEEHMLKARTPEEEKRIEEEMHRRLAKFGFQENQIEAVLDSKNASGSPTGTASGHDLHHLPASSQHGAAPTYIKVHKSHVDIETFKYFGLPWEYDVSVPRAVPSYCYSMCSADSMIDRSRLHRNSPRDGC
jgi:hypothetical protein